MDVDLDQLPIPDWGLECPQCRYPLRGLPEHRCPECGQHFNIRDLIRPWTRLRPPRFTGLELPLPDFGLWCLACHRPLAGAVAHACPHCAAPFDPRAWLPPGEWFIIDSALAGGLPVALLQSLLAAEQVPHTTADEKSALELYGGQSILTMRLRAPREFFFEILWLLRRAQQEAAAARAAGRRGQWRCRRCGETNPGHFEVCWNCQEFKVTSTK